MNQIIFQTEFGQEYKSYEDLKLILVSKVIGAAVPKTFYLDVEGADGVLDYTEAFGRVLYNNRTLDFAFQSIVDKSQFLTQYSNVQSLLHGRKFKIILSDDSTWYYTGRVSVSEYTNERGIAFINISAECEPYKTSRIPTVVEQDVRGTANVWILNSGKYVVPKITTDATMTFKYKGYTTTHNAGTFTLPQIELGSGMQTITVEGYGHVKFEYFMGEL